MKYYDPEYDKEVSEEYIENQYKWFKENLGMFDKGYEQFKKDNFDEIKEK